jgi:hypothetical protein
MIFIFLTENRNTNHSRKENAKKELNVLSLNNIRRNGEIMRKDNQTVKCDKLSMH